MNKREMLIELFKLKDRKRRRLLMDLFRDKIVMDISIKFICQLINNELERPDMVSEKDVVYCRFHFSKKTQQSSMVVSLRADNTEKPTVSRAEVNPDSEGLLWSDPDGNNFKKQSVITSKFSKS